MARDLTWNNISDNCVYIISEYNDSAENAFERNKIRKALNDKKTPQLLTEIDQELSSLYADIYQIDLYVYRAKKDNTIIEIELLRKSSLDAEYRKTIQDNPPSLHCKVAMPSYYQNKKEKFDIHWQNGTLGHWWKMLRWRQALKKEMKKRNPN